MTIRALTLSLMVTVFTAGAAYCAPLPWQTDATQPAPAPNSAPVLPWQAGVTHAPIMQPAPAAALDEAISDPAATREQDDRALGKYASQFYAITYNGKPSIVKLRTLLKEVKQYNVSLNQNDGNRDIKKDAANLQRRIQRQLKQWEARVKH